jgi:predicted site-specific integrase-resolvase
MISSSGNNNAVHQKVVRAAEAAQFYNVSIPTLRRWAREGSIPVQRTERGQYKYIIGEANNQNVHDILPNELSRNIIYARVSSQKQKGDLERQKIFLQRKYNDYSIVTDIGSGINYQRKGFKTILERLFKGNIQHVVVAHQDRFSRFSFDFFQWLFQQFGAVLEAVEQPKTSSPGEDLTADLMEVLTVFTARYYGRRKYIRGSIHEEDSDPEGEDIS